MTAEHNSTFPAPSARGKRRRLYSYPECIEAERPSHRRFIDIQGKVYGNLTVFLYAGIHRKEANWWCRCSCGEIALIPGAKLRVGKFKSCGCVPHVKRKKLARGICTVNGCDGLERTNGLCYKHYMRDYRSGDAAGLADKQRWFFDDLIRNPTNECVIWPFGKKDNGYGQFYIPNDKRRVTAHRYALMLLTGIDPADRLACHGPCNNRLCVNPHPQHGMYWGTYSENCADMIRDGTSKAALSDQQAIDVYNAYASGRKVVDIANEYEILSATVCAIAHRKAYIHLDMPVLPGRFNRITLN